MHKSGHMAETQLTIISTGVGGDCTSFVSQCIYAGAGIMNYDKIKGWYYINGNNKSPSWSGVDFLYQFLINNKGVGPYGKEVGMEQVKEGDIAQLLFQGNTFGHSLFIVSKKASRTENILVATHTFDSFGRKISSYSYQKIRFIHIEKIRKW